MERRNEQELSHVPIWDGIRWRCRCGWYMDGEEIESDKRAEMHYLNERTFEASPFAREESSTTD